MNIKTKKDFQSFTDAFWKSNKKPFITAIGQVYRDSNGKEIAVKYLTINCDKNYGTSAVLLDYFGRGKKDGVVVKKLLPENAKDIIERYFLPFKKEKNHANIDALRFGKKQKIELCLVVVEKESHIKEKKVLNLYDATLRLSLISRRCYKPNTLNLDGCFGALPNLVWTNKGVHTIEDWNNKWFLAEGSSEYILCQDRFSPIYWSNPVLPDVRIANPAMVRNGAYLGSGTTVMHYGFINFNAGSLGKSMIEGTVASGSTIDDGTDVGARAGMLGTLSGGNSIKITVGKNCLLGVDSEVGIALGDNVLVKEGTVFSSKTPICVIKWEKTKDGKFKVDSNNKLIIESEKVVKASELSNISNVTFRVNSQTGRMEVIPVPNKVQLNSLLHKNS